MSKKHASVRWTLRALATLACAIGALALSALLVLGLALAVAYPNLPDINGITDYRPKLPMRILSSDGILLGQFGEERRHFTPIARVPKVLQNAVLAAEDARFYQHSGVDYKGILRAALAQFRKLRSQGASTITMQVAKNFYLSTEKTFTRKIYEILLALRIESVLTKEQILELYMNQIYLGQRAFGFAAASEIYFGKSLADIGLAEAAMLAGLPKAPSTYNPIVNPTRARVRQLYIFNQMLRNGLITKAQADAAKQIELRYRPPSQVPVHAEFAAETARQMIFSRYGNESYTRGLTVYLSINVAEQMAAYRALRKGIMGYERRQAYRGPEAYIDLPADPSNLDSRISEALLEHPDHDELRAGVVLSVSRKKVVAMLQSGEAINVVGAGLKPVASGLSARGNPKTKIRPGAVIRLIKSNKASWTITQRPEVEGAFVALDPLSGRVRALVGGFDYAKSKFNHVTQAWRQPGSSFKPFIYSAALERGFTASTVINDAPLFFDAGTTGSQPWEPRNYDGRFDGPMPLRKALAKSKNMVSIRILRSIDPLYAQAWATRFGFDANRHPAYLTMALGAGSVTPLQMATAYAVFANGGYRVKPALITKVIDARGNTLNEVKPTELNEASRVIDARNAFMMTQLLQEVTRSGTAHRAQRLLKRPDICGKTGTTNRSLDTWFAGYQRSVVAVVWMGYDNPRKLGDRETGGSLSLPVWIDYMKFALNGVPIDERAAPEGVLKLRGDWYYEEYTPSLGIDSLGLDENLPATPDEHEKKSILDLFRG